MLIKNQKREFYECIQHKRVLILVAFDVDALCACKILQYLLQCDHIVYTIVPVAGKEDLEKAYVDNSEGIQHVVMINCGASIDVVELLQPEDGVCFYICDSHRPVDVNNMYNAVQVKLLVKPDDLTNVPEFDEVFRDEEESEESDDDEDGGGRKKLTDEVIMRRQERRKWEENRNKVLFDYMKFSSYGTAASLVMFEMVWKLSKDTNDLAWLAVIGVTDQFVHFRIPREKYMESVMALQSHVSRHNHRGDEDETLMSVNCLKIMFDEELQLTLYRHWSLFDSLCHSMNMACRFKIWTLKGQKRLHEFLAEMGIPLVQCKQQYSAMDSQIKADVKRLMQEHMTKYGLTMQDLILPSFIAHYGFKIKLCAADVVLGCAAVLEGVDRNKSPTDNFLEAQDVLNRSNTESLEKAIVSAKRQASALMAQVRTFQDTHQIACAGPFLYAVMQEGSADLKFFSQPQCLTRLARFLLEAQSVVTRNRRVTSIPLVLTIPTVSDSETLLVIGIPPLDTDDERKNFFGKAFEQAAASTTSRTRHNFFDTHIIELKSSDRTKFLDALVSLLT
ncbi:cell division control protein 45 homolog [Babylonia areolata]|uniref:cell division control protein 45 homolog n=1 Tax=Babylonia areolata TaxID=304850 RepID=UPI003FD20B98